MANSTQVHCVYVDPRAHQPCSVDETLYGFIPAGIVFVILFTLASVALVPQPFLRWPRGRFMIATSVCAVAEIVGWAFRIQGHYRPFASWSYIAQMVILIVAPVFLSASNYIGLDHIFACVGYEMARFKKKVYLSTFLTLDILSLVVQALGGGSAGSNDSSSSSNAGKIGMYIALGGVGLQVVATLLYLILLVDFLHRHRRTYLREEAVHTTTPSPAEAPSQSASFVVSVSEQSDYAAYAHYYRRDGSSGSQGTLNGATSMGADAPELLAYGGRWTRGTRQFAAALVFASLCLLVRCAYRAAEMSGFSNNYLFAHEWYLCVFDGVPIFFALSVLLIVQAVAIYHPSRVLPLPWSERQHKHEKHGLVTLA